MQKNKHTTFKKKGVTHHICLSIIFVFEKTTDHRSHDYDRVQKKQKTKNKHNRNIIINI